MIISNSFLQLESNFIMNYNKIGPEGLRDFCYQKSLVTDRFGFIVPPPSALFFPSPSTVHFFVQDFIYILHGRTIGDKVRGILNLLKKFISKPKVE